MFFIFANLDKNKGFKMKFWLLLIACLLINNNVMANDNRGEARERIEPKGYLYGFGLGINQEIYKGYDYRFIPLPILGYRGDDFSVLGPFVRYDALQISDVELSIQAAPRFQGFDESDSYIFKNMADRSFSMDAGLGLSYEKNNWKINFSAMFDVLAKSKGYEAKANISRVFRQGPIFIEPSFSLSYLDSNHVDYYYGVKPNEINDNTYQYQGESALNTSLSLSLATPILFEGFSQIVFDYSWYDSSIGNSPLVDKDTNLSVRLLFSKFF
jgi:outer membrane protein